MLCQRHFRVNMVHGSSVLVLPQEDPGQVLSMLVWVSSGCSSLMPLTEELELVPGHCPVAIHCALRID